MKLEKELLWYGLIDKIIIEPCSSGTYRVKIESKMMIKKEFDSFILEVFERIRAPMDVEE